MPVLLDLDGMCPVREEQFKIYNIEVNTETLDFDYSRSVVEFDSGGDINLKLKVDDEDLLGIIKVESIISYMEGLGYNLIE